MSTHTDVAVSQVTQVADQAWARMLERSPYHRVRQGLPVSWIPSGSPKEVEEDARFAAAQLSVLDAVDTDQLDAQTVITDGVLRHLFEQQVAAVEDQWYAFAVTPYSTYTLTLYVDHVFKRFAFASREDGERYVRLLHDFAAVVRVMHDHTQEQSRRGMRLPGAAMPGAMGAIAGHRANADASLRVSRERLAGVDGGLAGRIDAVVDGEILPAFDQLLGYLDVESRAHLPESVGLAQYPGGEEAYRRLVRRHATLDISPEEVHQTGLDQVAAITAEMERVRGRLGFEGSEADFHLQLASTPRLFAKTPDEVEQRYVAYMDRLEPHLSGYFRVLPRAKYGVARLDLALEPGMTYGYYEPPTPDQPVGRYRYNASNLEHRSMLTAGAIIYHELAPGHHFHIARQAENESLHLMRREGVGFTAYNEGWAEYASNLAREIGLLDDYELYGRLVHERFTAQRLVIDTGMNLLGWSLDAARQYMRSQTLEPDAQVASETLRYATDLPGQALAYRMGFLKIMELRQKAKAALGESFDIRDFHEAVLGGGAMPLTVLDRHITHHVEERSGATA